MRKTITVAALLLLTINLSANEKIEFPGKGFYKLDRGDEWLNTKHYSQSCQCTADMHLDKKTAKECYMNSCLDGNAKGCYGVAFIYDIQGYKDKAKEFYIKSCDLGYMSGCKEYRALENNGI